jgi:hypothetical protein
VKRKKEKKKNMWTRDQVLEKKLFNPVRGIKTPAGQGTCVVFANPQDVLHEMPLYVLIPSENRYLKVMGKAIPNRVLVPFPGVAPMGGDQVMDVAELCFLDPNLFGEDSFPRFADYKQPSAISSVAKRFLLSQERKETPYTKKAKDVLASLEANQDVLLQKYPDMKRNLSNLIRILHHKVDENHVSSTLDMSYDTGDKRTIIFLKQLLGEGKARLAGSGQFGQEGTDLVLDLSP